MTGLEGTINEFSVADVLQLICQQQKTGVLVVEHKGQKDAIHIEDGRIVSAGPAKYRLGEILIRAHKLNPEDLQRALYKQEENYELLGEILVKQGSITPESLEQAVNNQIYETLYDVFQWKEGTYQFNPQQNYRPSSTFKPMNFQSVLLDVLRMIDEWPEIHSFIPSLDIRFQKSLTMPEQNFQGEALLVHNLINGTRTVQEIIDESLLGRFNTCKILSEFLQAGYISKASFTPATPRKSPAGIFYKRALAACQYALPTAIFVILSVLVLSAPQNILPILSPGLIKQSYLADYLNNSRLLRIDNAREIYKITHGVDPENLQQLVNSGALNPDDLMPPGEKTSHVLEHDSSAMRFERRAK